MKRILCILIFVLGFQTFYSQTDYHLVDIENDSVFDDMKLLDTIDGSYRLYFSGENHTYQTSNLKLELKLLKYFHQNHGVNTLLLEFGNVTGWLVNEYIVTGEEKLEKALKINFSKNFVNYFKEIKKYNDSLPKADRIKVVGIDVQRSVQIGFEMMNYLLPPDSILPEDSISQQIELIRFLQGYNKSTNSWRTEGRLNYFGNRNYGYSNLKSMKLVVDNFNKFEIEYKKYLGDNLVAFEEFVRTMENSMEYFEKRSSGTPIGILHREQFMYNKINSMAKENPLDKFYGQFGRNHTLKNVRSDNYAYNFSSVTAKIDKNPESVLHDKVFLMGIYYVENAMNNSNNYNNRYKVEEVILESVKKFPKGKIGIVKIEKESKLDSVLNQNYDYIIVHNGDRKDEPNGWNYNYYDETISFNFVFGQYSPNLSPTGSYLGLSETIGPLKYWGVGYSYLYDRFYYDFQFQSILKTKYEINDTSSAEFGGSSLSFNLGYDLLKTRKFDFIPTAGIGYQRTKLRVEIENAINGLKNINSVELNLRNPSVFFDFSGEFRVRLVEDFLGLSIKSGYRLDISKYGWRYGDSKLDNVKFNQSGLFFQAGICLGSY